MWLWTTLHSHFTDEAQRVERCLFFNVPQLWSQSQDLNLGAWTPGQCSVHGLTKLYYWAPWQGGKVRGQRERDSSVLMTVSWKWPKGAKSHEAEKEREVLAWKLRRKSQKFIIFLEDGQDIKRMRAMWAESGFWSSFHHYSTERVWLSTVFWASTLNGVGFSLMKVLLLFLFKFLGLITAGHIVGPPYVFNRLD